jgi:hypothetical protein
MPTVGRWRARFGKNRLAGLADAPRPVQPRKISDAKVEHPQHCGQTQSAIHRIWKTFGLKPHLQENFKISANSFFVETLRGVVRTLCQPAGANTRLGALRG